jgi:septum formation protein
MATSQSESNDSPVVVVDPVQALGLPHPIILGSASFTRKLILKEMGIQYEIVVRSIDEKSLGDRSKDKPSDLVLTLAQAKCVHLVREIQNGNTDVEPTRECIVLTGDQVVTHESEILEKPEDIHEAIDFVARYGRSPPSTVGSCVLTHLPSNIQVSGVDTATIHFRPSIAESNLIEQLVALGEPVMSCAGGLMVEHPLVKEYLDYIDGTEDSVMGLSKGLVLRLLEEMSMELTKAGYKK